MRRSGSTVPIVIAESKKAALWKQPTVTGFGPFVFYKDPEDLGREIPAPSTEPYGVHVACFRALHDVMRRTELAVHGRGGEDLLERDRHRARWRQDRSRSSFSTVNCR